MLSPHKLLFALLTATGFLISAGPAQATEVCDLIHNVSCPAIDGRLFFAAEQRPAAIGFVDAVLRIQQNQGRPVPPNQKPVNGQYYYEFFLDVNEPANTKKNSITLDQVEVYASPAAGLNNHQNGGIEANGVSGCLGIQGQVCGSQSAKIYDLDDAVGTRKAHDNSAQIDYLVSGNASGTGDLVFYLSTQLSDNAAANGSWYVYLFSQFGNRYTLGNKSGSPTGADGWWARDLLDDGGQPLTPVPEPGSLLLLGSGLAWGAHRWRHRA